MKVVRAMVCLQSSLFTAALAYSYITMLFLSFTRKKFLRTSPTCLEEEVHIFNLLNQFDFVIKIHMNALGFIHGNCLT